MALGKTVELDSKTITFELFNDGKTVEEIAKERNLTISTIHSHLSFFIGTGELDIHKLVSEKNVLEIQELIKEHEAYKMSEIKEHFADKYTYGEIKMVLSHLT